MSKVMLALYRCFHCLHEIRRRGTAEVKCPVCGEKMHYITTSAVGDED